MEQNNNTKKQLFFDETFLEVSSDILQKYKLEETPEELIEKLKTDKSLFCEIVMDIIRDFYSGTIKESEIISSLKSKLNLSEENVINLTNDIKTKIFPLIKLINEGEYEEETQTEEDKLAKGSEVFTKIKSPIGIPIKPETIEKDFISKETNKSLEESEKIKKIIKEDIKITTEKPKKAIKRQSDSYREPTE